MNFNELLPEDLAVALVGALMNGKDFSYAKDGLTIKAGVDDKSINLHCSYAPNTDTKNSNREAFYKFCDDMDENLFVEVCEAIPNLKEVNDMIESEDIETGIDIFYKTLSKVVNNKVAKLDKEIEQISECLEAINAERAELLQYISE